MKTLREYIDILESLDLDVSGTQEDSRKVQIQALEALDLAQALLEKSAHHETILNAYKALRRLLEQTGQGVREGSGGLEETLEDPIERIDRLFKNK